MRCLSGSFSHHARLSCGADPFQSKSQENEFCNSRYFLRGYLIKRLDLASFQIAKGRDLISEESHWATISLAK